MLILFITLSGCKSVEFVEKPIEVKSVEYRDKLRVDSIHLHDSIYVQRLNDTVFVERFKTEFRYKLRVDTLVKIDSIPVPYAVVERVNSLTTWQKGLQVLGYMTIGMILLGLVCLIIKISCI